MTQALQHWVRRLEGGPLPVLKRTLSLVREQLNSASVNHQRLAEIISRDPAFSLHILRCLNSLPTRPKEPVARISLALPLLGMGMLEQACRSLPVVEERLKGAARHGLLTCIGHSVHAALYAKAFAGMRGERNGDSLYTAALLHDIAEMALWNQAPEQMLEIKRLIHQGEERDNAAMAVLECSFEALNLELSRHWSLPELIATSQGLSNSYLPGPLTVMLAVALARESHLGWQRGRTLDDLELLAEFLDVPLESAAARLHRLAAEAARQLSPLPVPLPAFYLISSDAAAYPRQQSPAGPRPQATPSPEPRQATPVKHPPLHEAFLHSLQEMRTEHGLKRAMFALLNKERSQLRARLVLEEKNASLNGFCVDLVPPNLFSLLLKKPQALAVKADNCEKYRDMIPPPLRNLVSTENFLVMSVFLHNRPIGLFYADNGPGIAITPRQYENFKASCQRAIHALS